MRATPLDAKTRAYGAVSGDDAGWQVALTYGDADAEANAVREGTGVADLSHWGHFTLEGKNSTKFLQGLVTNDVAALVPGAGCFAAFLNTHGRIEAVAHIFSFGDNRLLLQTPPEATEWVAKGLGRFRLAGGFDLTHLDDCATISVQGPGAHGALAAALGAELPTPLWLTCREVAFEGETLRVFGVRRTEFDGADVSGPAAAIETLVERLTESGDGAASTVGLDALEILRLEAGVPRFARDYDADTVLQEVDIPEIVSFHKGCYLGQEIVARIHFQGQPSKLLRRLVVDGDALPEPGAEVVTADEEAKVAGRVTSAARSASRGPLAFGMIKRKYYAPDTPLRVRHGDGDIAATVAVRVPARRLQETR